MQLLAQAPEKEIASKVLAIPLGAMVKVRLTNNEKLRGRLREVGDRTFVLRVARNNQIENRTIAFDEVQSISRLHPPGRARLTNWLIAAAVVGGITVIALIAIHAMHG